MTPRFPSMLLVLLAAPAVPARAFDPAYDYASIRAGTFVPQGSSVRSFNAGVDAELTVGRAFLDFLAGDVAVGFAWTESDVRSIRYPEPGIAEVPGRERYRLIPVTASLKLILPAGSVQPYLAGGGGIYFARIERDPSGPLPAITQSETVFGFHAGGGAMVRVSERFFTGFDARYVFAHVKRWFSAGRVALSGARVTATLGIRF